MADAIYENQTNLREAKRVVEAVVEHIATRSDESLGIVTLNIKQRDLIAELLEERLKSVRGADAYREHWAIEGQPLFIKNLENVMPSSSPLPSANQLVPALFARTLDLSVVKVVGEGSTFCSRVPRNPLPFTPLCGPKTS